MRGGSSLDFTFGAAQIYVHVKQGGHAPADFIRQIELEYDKLNAM